MTSHDTALDLDAIEQAITAYRKSHGHPNAFACCTAHPVADHAAALLAEVRRLLATAEAFRTMFGNVIVHGQDGDWANVADFLATGARIPACGSFYPPAVDTRCVLHQGHRGNHRAPWGDRVMAWPYDPRETHHPLTAEELATAQADVDHLNAEFPEVTAGRDAAAIELREAARKAIARAEAERDAARTLTESQYSAAWHAVEGAAGEEGADPATILHAVLDRLGIAVPGTARSSATIAGRRLHLVIDPPEPGEWYGRLDVTEALEAAGWESDETRTVLKHDGTTWALLNESDDSGLDCPNGSVIEFPGSTPTVVIVAACLAAAHPAP